MPESVTGRKVSGNSSPGDVAGEVFGGETQLDQGLLKPAPLGRRHLELQGRQPRPSSGAKVF